MTNFEEKLNRIKIRDIGQEDQNSLWHRISVEKVKLAQKKSLLSTVNLYILGMNKIMIGALALVLVFGGAGMVAASNNARPGDNLFGVDLALEKMQIRLAGEEKKSELKLRFAQEREEEVREISESRRGDDSDGSTRFTAEENADLSVALSNLEILISEESNSDNEAELRATLEDILILLEGDTDIEIRRENGKIEIETKSDGSLEIEFENEDGDDDSKNRSSSDDDSSDDSRNRSGDDDSEININLDGSIFIGDEKEDENEVFCRGEWRDSKDCDDSDDDRGRDSDDSGKDDDDEDEEDDNSGSGGGNDD